MDDNLNQFVLKTLYNLLLNPAQPLKSSKCEERTTYENEIASHDSTAFSKQELIAHTIINIIAATHALPEIHKDPRAAEDRSNDSTLFSLIRQITIDLDNPHLSNCMTEHTGDVKTGSNQEDNESNKAIINFLIQLNQLAQKISATTSTESKENWERLRFILKQATSQLLYMPTTALSNRSTHQTLVRITTTVITELTKTLTHNACAYGGPGQNQPPTENNLYALAKTCIDEISSYKTEQTDELKSSLNSLLMIIDNPTQQPSAYDSARNAVTRFKSMMFSRADATPGEAEATPLATVTNTTGVHNKEEKTVTATILP